MHIETCLIYYLQFYVLIHSIMHLTFSCYDSLYFQPQAKNIIEFKCINIYRVVTWKVIFMCFLIQHTNNTHVINTHPVLLTKTDGNSEGVPSTIRRCFSHEVKMRPLTEEQRVEMLSQSLQPELLWDVSNNILFFCFYL